MAKVKSFSKAQKDLLATKFLDLLGDDEDSIVFFNTADAMGRLVEILFNEVTKNLEKSTATGALASSFTPLDPRRVGKDVVVDIEALAYYQFLNRGVKGTKRGFGEFAFKSPYPSKQMVKSISDWMKTQGMAQRIMKPNYKSISKLEVKRKSIAQLDGAYAVARSIKQNGIKKTGFFDKAFETTNKIANQELGKALKIDIINSLPTHIDGTGN